MSYGATDVLGNNLPLRGWKGQLYEGGIRVPALMYWPGHLKPGKRATPMLVCDLLPTLASAAGTGMPVDESVEGVDLWNVLARNVQPAPRTMYWTDGASRAVRQGEWKLIKFGRSPDEGKSELYNLAGDPYETKDLAAAHPDVLNRLQAELARQASGDLP